MMVLAQILARVNTLMQFVYWNFLHYPLALNSQPGQVSFCLCLPGLAVRNISTKTFDVIPACHSEANVSIRCIKTGRKYAIQTPQKECSNYYHPGMLNADVEGQKVLEGSMVRPGVVAFTCEPCWQQKN